jgi:hypothetical protein
MSYQHTAKASRNSSAIFIKYTAPPERITNYYNSIQPRGSTQQQCDNNGERM